MIFFFTCSNGEKPAGFCPLETSIPFGFISFE